MVSGTAVPLALFLILVASAQADNSPFPGCRGKATYNITFYNFLTSKNFGSAIPADGLVFSPLAGASHSGRISILTVRGFASRAVQDIAELGDNSRLVTVGSRLQRKGRGVKDLAAAAGPTMPGGKTTLTLDVDCANSFVTVLGMVAPSPDWLVQISNVNLYNTAFRKFINYAWEYLIAYDGGTDSGSDFTPPGDTSLDVPTKPKQNIAPLEEDETNPFGKKVIGKYTIEKLS